MFAPLRSPTITYTTKNIYRLNMKILIYYFGWRPEVTKLINFGIFLIFVLSIYPMQEP